MAKKKGGGITRLNPPFDARMATIGAPSRSKLKRGFLIHAPIPGTTNSGTKGRIDFLYNPTTITVQHSIDPAQIGPDGQPKEMADVDQKGNMVGIGNVSFDLLYDRTFELWDGSKKNSLAGKLGVYADVLAFYHFIGLTSPVSKKELNTEGGLIGLITSIQNNNQSTFAAGYPIAPARPTLAYAYVGQNLKYHGQITNLSIQYTHWNRDMIPTRAAISFGLQLQADASKATTKIAAGALYNTAGATSTSTDQNTPADDGFGPTNYGNFEGLGGE